jgi:hypothetical protein
MAPSASFSTTAPAGPVQCATLGGVSVRLMDRQPSFWAKVARGEWEPHTMGGIIEEVGPGTLFLDVGAWSVRRRCSRPLGADRWSLSSPIQPLTSSFLRTSRPIPGLHHASRLYRGRSAGAPVP